MKQITIIGLGLIGGSMAKALHGFQGAQIVGVDHDPVTLQKALDAGAIHAAMTNASEAVSQADLVILCVAPHQILSIMEECKDQFKQGAVVTDVCGTKTHLYREMGGLFPSNTDYVGIHPMAGKEQNGFDFSEKELFQNCGMIITPLPQTRPESIALMKQLAHHIGTDRVTVAEPELHDDIIAYTSDLMHISAVALCEEFHPQMTSVFTAGAFRDCTRVAFIDPDLWTDLLLTNAEYILPHLDDYLDTLQRMRQAISEGDNKTIYTMLERADRNKKEMLTR